MPSISAPLKSQSPPRAVSMVLVLHLLIAVKIAVENYRFFELWFESPELRIRTFAVRSPINEAIFITYVALVLGLALRKPWSWWLALVLDAYFVLHAF